MRFKNTLFRPFSWIFRINRETLFAIEIQNRRRASNFGLCFAYAVSHVLQNYAYRSIAILGYLGLLHFAIQRT